MKKTLSIILVFIICVGMFSGCKTETEPPQETSSAIGEEPNTVVIRPLPETLNVNTLDNCTVSASLEKGGAYIDDSGKMMMDIMVYTYELYDMQDISSLKENDVIVRHSEEIKIELLERLDTGLVRINGGEENGGFDLISNDSTVYYEIGMSDAKSYYELGEVTLPVSDEFECVDESDLDAGARIYYPGDFLAEDGDIEYNFTPNNTSIVIENGTIVKMRKIYTP